MSSNSNNNEQATRIFSRQSKHFYGFFAASAVGFTCCCCCFSCDCCWQLNFLGTFYCRLLQVTHLVDPPSPPRPCVALQKFWIFLPSCDFCFFFFGLFSALFSLRLVRPLQFCDGIFWLCVCVCVCLSVCLCVCFGFVLFGVLGHPFYLPRCSVRRPQPTATATSTATTTTTRLSI